MIVESQTLQQIKQVLESDESPMRLKSETLTILCNFLKGVNYEQLGYLVHKCDLVDQLTKSLNLAVEA